LAAAAIVANPFVIAFVSRDTSQFLNLIVAGVLLLIGLPVYFLWRRS